MGDADALGLEISGLQLCAVRGGQLPTPCMPEAAVAAEVFNRDWSGLPMQPLAHILRFIDIQHRLCSCALVSTRWAEAAVVATDSIVLHTTLTSPTASLQHWLLTHGHQLTQLQLSGSGRKVLSALPCPKLQDLLLHRCQLLLEPEGQLCHHLAAATCLRTLRLLDISAAGTADVLAAVAALPRVQHLRLGELVSWCSKQAGCGSVVKIPSGLLQKLPHLTQLQLAGSLGPSSLQHLGLLTELRHLELAELYALEPQGLAGLQQLLHLTCLKLSNLQCSIGSSTLRNLTALQHLELSGSCAVQLSALANNLQLQHLSLKGVTVLARTGSFMLSTSAAANTALLPLHNLQQLTCLELWYVGGLASHPAECLRGMTASGTLRCLRLIHTPLPEAPNPWQQMFAEGSQMPQLHSLQLFHANPKLQFSDVCRLVRCAPGLQQLDVTASVSAPSQLQPLLHLSRLTSLSVSHASEETLRGIARWLTGLCVLSLRQAPGCDVKLKAESLGQLTALKQLAAVNVDVQVLECGTETAAASPSTEGSEPEDDTGSAGGSAGPSAVVDHQLEPHST